MASNNVVWVLRYTSVGGLRDGFCFMEGFYRTREELRKRYMDLKPLTFMKVEKYRVSNYLDIGKRSYVKIS